MDCPDYNTLAAFVRGEVSDEERATLQEHLDRCSTCLGVVVELAQDSDPTPLAATRPHTEFAEDTISEDTIASRGLKTGQLHHGASLAVDYCPPGTSFDHFRIIRLLGRGGMGEVYLARDEQLGRKVALKVIRRELSSTGDSLERFLFEARTTARFNHPHIVTIYAVGQVNGTPYVALEYLEGQNLADRASEYSLSAYESLRICLAIAQAIDEAHRHDVMHRDLKPENVLIPTDGRVRVVDFGLAYALDPEAQEETSTSGSGGGGKIHGTPAYMAPEQWAGEVTPTTDVWAIGLILHELMSGNRPYPDSSPIVMMHRVISDEEIPLDEGLEEAPPGVVELIRDCLRKNPRARPSASEVVERLMEQIYEGRRHFEQGESPFRGLLAFAERHADYFFGRDAEISACSERLRQESIMAIVGPSGVGKSSFIQAGVIPRLREGARWIVLRIRPADDPLRRLASKLVAALKGESGSNPVGSAESAPNPTPVVLKIGEDSPAPRTRSDAVRELYEILEKTPHMASVYLRELALQRDAKVLLLVDQMEELFTLSRDEASQAAFVEAICGAADDPAEPVRVVFTLRDDFLGSWANMGESAREVLGNVMILKSPDGETLREVLTKPLEITGHTYDDPDLVDSIIDSVEPATSLPLVQFTARTLWDMRDREARVLRRSDYESIGGVEGALASHAEDVMLGFTLSEFETTRALALRLVTPERTRRVLSEKQLIDGLGPDAPAVLERLTKSRLISAGRADDDGTGEARVELAHESLIHTWPTLARWVNEGADQLAFMSDVTQAAELWDRRGRSSSELWEGAALSEAIRARSRSTVGLPSLVEAFLDASEARDQRQRRRRRFWVTALPVILSMVVLIVTMQKMEADDQRDEAQRQKGLVDNARVVAESARERALEGQVDALLQSARGDYQAGRVFPARAKLRAAAERRPETSISLRSLWWRLSNDPLMWSHTMGAVPYSVDWTEDKDRIAIGVQDRAIYLFEGPTHQMRLIRGHEDQVVSVGLSPDGKFVVSGDAQGFLQLVEAERPASAQRWKAHKATIKQVQFDPKGRLFAAASAAEPVSIWDSQTRRLVRKLDVGRQVLAFDFSFDGRRFAILNGGKVHLFDPSNDWSELPLEGVPDTVADIAFHPSRPVLALGIGERVRLLNLETGKVERELTGRRGELRKMAIRKDGKELAAWGRSKGLTLWDLTTGEARWNLPSRGSMHITDAAFSPDGGRIVLTYSDRLVALYRTDIDLPTSGDNSHTDAVYGVSVSPEGRLVASAGLDGKVCLWKRETGKVTRCFMAETKGLGSIDFDPSGERLAYAGWDGIVRILNMETQGTISLLGHVATVIQVVFSPDGKKLASVGDDGTVRVWNADTGAPIHTLKGHKNVVMGVAFSSDGSMLASGSTDRTVRLWNVETGQLLHRLNEHKGPVLGLTFLDNDTKLATGGYDENVLIWDTKTGKRLAAGPDVKGRVYRLSADPANQRIAVGSSMPFVQIVGRDGVVINQLHGHTRDTNDVDYSLDGKHLASVSDDGTVRVWDAKSGSSSWYTSALVHSPVRLLSHLGKERLDGTTTAEATSPAWEASLTDGQTSAVMSGDGGLVCVQRQDKQIEFWDVKNNASLGTVASKSTRMLGLTSGCVFMADDGVRVVDARGSWKSLELPGIPRAIGVGGGDVLVVTTKVVSRFAPDGRLLLSIPTSGNVTALTITQEEDGEEMLVLGYPEGNLELRTLEGDIRNITFRQVPSSPAVRVIPGPDGTLLVGYGNGVVGLWSLEDGSLINKHRLHGRAEHLLLKGSRFYAATDLGAHLTWDLQAFTVGRCSMVRKVWDRTEVTWQRGRVVAQPPPADDSCAQPKSGDSR